MTPDLSPWGDVRDLTPLPGGARRLAFRGLLHGRPIIAKSGALSEPSLRWQRQIEAAARRAGIVTPGLIATRFGALSAGGWTVEPALDGRPATAADLAGLPLARFHAQAKHLPQRPGAPRRLPPNWHRLAVLPGSEGGIHGDLHLGNLLRVSSGRLALLDWEEARRGPLAIDGARPGSPTHLRAELAACAQSEPARARPRPPHGPDLAASCQPTCVIGPIITAPLRI